MTKEQRGFIWHVPTCAGNKEQYQKIVHVHVNSEKKC